MFLVRNAEEYSGSCTYHRGTVFHRAADASSIHGRDVRVWVIDSVARAAVLRSSSSRFVIQLFTGGEACLYPLIRGSCRARRCRRQRTRAVFFCGVDLLFTDDGFCIM